MLRAAEVVRAEFGHGRRGEGLDEKEVDDFLDRVVVALRAYEAGRDEEVTLTSRDLDGVAFPAARGLGRRGYNPDGVHGMLTKARETLRVYEAQAARRAQASARDGDGSDASSRSAGRTTRKGVFGTLLGR